MIQIIDNAGGRYNPDSRYEGYKNKRGALNVRRFFKGRTATSDVLTLSVRLKGKGIGERGKNTGRPREHEPLFRR